MLTTAEVSQFLVTFSSVVSQNDFKVQELPLARIKKIMKQDEEVKVNVFASIVGSFAAHFHVDIGLVIIHKGYYIVEQTCIQMSSSSRNTTCTHLLQTSAVKHLSLCSIYLMRYDPKHIFYTLFSFDLCLDKLLYQSKIVSLYVNKLLTFHILVQRTVTIDM